MRRKMFLGCPVDLVGLEDLRSLYREALASGVRLRIEGVNVAKIVQARENPELLEALLEAEAAHVDGMGVRWGLALCGFKGAERVAGIDLFLEICAHCAETGRSVFLLGAAQDVLERAAAALVAAYPGLRIAGLRNGYFGPQEWEDVAGAIRDSGADALFIGISSPKKERFLAASWERLGVSLGMGVGGSFDVVAGDLTRAPRFLQRAGLEWFWRLAQQPRRLVGRYVVTNTIFAGLLLAHLVRRAARVRDAAP